jgi:hypothetical protein
MRPFVRKLALTVHVSCSVGWFGAVGVFLVLAATGLASSDTRVEAGMYLAMQVTGWFVIVPLCLASFATGIVQSLGTPWGLLRHYWVIIKLVITVLASAFLLLHMTVVDRLARASSDGSLVSEHGFRVQIVADAAVALVALMVTTVLATYKPRGTTRYGRRTAASRF